ncbi:MAG: VWA domain-containing protein [Acidobacteriaceae bacterium]|nr:VWA domain-containing protein [Acidobacteriaceae bacterium]MBV9780554.1 VWA domain-containing protein [Acidobacteriaceae bacterium]
MKYRFVVAALAGLALILTSVPLYVRAQDSPQSQSSDSVAKPKPKPGENPQPDQQQIPSEYKKQKEAPPNTPTFEANATTVSVDVAVLDNKGRFIPAIPQDKFRVLEDGVPQQITQFGKSEAPITICMLIEFSGRFQAFWSYGWYETLQASYGFLETLKPDDNVAVVEFDMRPTILSDFSPDKRKAEEAMARLRIPGFSESNIFDALTDMADRMSGIEGRKAILVIATGLDTFSRITFDQARKSLQESGVPIYSISILQIARIMAESRGMGPIQEMDFLQADNEMKTFAKETGGQAYFPRFLGEYPGVFRAVQDSLRNQYSLAYHPTNTAKDGKFRHIKVELVNPSTNEPLRIVENGKTVKYQILAKAGYKAPREVD